MREIRKNKGISQQLLANQMNVKQQVLSRYETQQSAPTLERLVQIAQILGVTLDELVEFKQLHGEYSNDLKIKRK